MQGNKLVLLKKLDFEKKSQYTITITATDNGTPPLSTKITVTVKVVGELLAEKWFFGESSLFFLFLIPSHSHTQRYRFESRRGQWALFSLMPSALSFVFL